jgi:hypothetical protein
MDHSLLELGSSITPLILSDRMLSLLPSDCSLDVDRKLGRLPLTTALANGLSMSTLDVSGKGLSITIFRESLGAEAGIEGGLLRVLFNGVIKSFFG